MGDGGVLCALGSVQQYFSGKSVLVTGAAGSVGRALSLRLARLGCARLGLLDHFDHGLIEAADAVAAVREGPEVEDILGDVRDRERLWRQIEAFGPDIVIHAAALKHVHLGERHPGECVLTNLVGVRNALEAAAEAGVGRFLLISTDKAAAPASVMGACKRLAEMYLRGFLMERPGALAAHAVRFANVMGSQGSVAERFAAQIADGGPVRVTHPEMTRHFMSVEEAVDLVLTVGANESGENAAVYFKRVGDPVSILQLARELIASQGGDIPIEFTGVRAGEKLSEQLTDEHEIARPTDLDGVHVAAPISANAYMITADVEELGYIARTADAAFVRARVFAALKNRLERADVERAAESLIA